MSNVKLSIIIVSYNNLNVLLDCLNSVEKMNDISDQQEVIVVEQSPSDEIYTYLKKNMPQIQTIRAENKGFGAGNNRGVEIANRLIRRWSARWRKKQEQQLRVSDSVRTEIQNNIFFLLQI